MSNKPLPTVLSTGKIVLSTGTVLEPCAGTIGIAPDLEVTHGYDGMLYRPADAWDDPTEKTHAMTAAEQLELADLMIERWQKFRARAVSNIQP
ncbi:MAG: hypothetical protein KIS62_01485 [Ramlibacter sp.]|nr:hypothetical protein [Ramlibacter sp.]